MNVLELEDEVISNLKMKCLEPEDEVVPIQMIMMMNPKQQHQIRMIICGQIFNKILNYLFSKKMLTYSNPFLRRVETYCHNVLQYEDKNLQERTRKLIPITILEENAQNKLRNIQEFIKKNKLKDCELSLQDTLILELLQWFKEEFFEWVDSPECESCGDETSFSHMSTDSHLLQYTDRVELHRCKSCHQFTPFPRYNDLNILLETRRGRCGEWANTFTLCCRAMGWDSRFIVDEGDHVWTEVYSMTQKRWIHCDPCENICDTPLVYESGWHKSISYIMAYSIEDIQDVTWRYSSDHKAVLKRRNNCSETELLNAILKIRSGLQKNLSGPRKNYLTNRTFMELVEFLTEKKPNDSEQKGRSSGSDVWRLARGEIQEPFKEALWLWRIDNKEIMDNTVTLRYSSVLDKYEYLSGGKVLKTITGWHKGAFKHSGVFRKEEKDWKMVYLARKENAEKGLLSWKFDLSNSQMILDTVELTLEYDTFENGVVDAQICDENTCLSLPKGEKMALFDNFTESKELTVTASLSGGKGDVFWQHAQLFRQSTTNESFNFSLTLTFMK
ncbi:hypothetical protein JTB14_028954 [Gonioctena quinquepunctata]|nr:hypothetical protein JTB14_028954 [Gonioctena quinquepunctata]